MLTFPVPLFGALVLGFLAVRAFLAPERSLGLLVFLVLCAVQSLVLALGQHYGVHQALVIQPITAALISPVAWCAFVASARRNLHLPLDALHGVGPVATLVSCLVLPMLVDVLVPLLFFGYGVALVISASDKSDALPRVRLDDGLLPHRLWRIVGYVLIASALSDVLIVAAQILGYSSLQPLMVSVFSSAFLLILGLLSLSRALTTTPSESFAGLDKAAIGSESAVSAVDLLPDQQDESAHQDQKLVDALELFLRNSQLFLEPDLNLARLSRKVSIPAKRLSAAINRCTGDNVSRTINRYRIEHACALISQGSSVTAAIHASGFNTKSNFNREFNRVMKVTPTEWAQSIP